MTPFALLGLVPTGTGPVLCVKSHLLSFPLLGDDVSWFCRYRVQYPSLAYMVTENGIADAEDTIRRVYMLEHLAALHAAMGQVPLHSLPPAVPGLVTHLAPRHGCHEAGAMHVTSLLYLPHTCHLFAVCMSYGMHTTYCSPVSVSKLLFCGACLMARVTESSVLWVRPSCL